MSRAALKDRVTSRRFGRRGAFVQQGIKRLYLFDGTPDDPDSLWIDVKSRLTYGEAQQVAGAMLDTLLLPQDDEGGDPDEVKERLRRTLEIRLDVASEGPTTLLAWLVDWNLEDENGSSVAVSLEALLLLDPEVAKEMSRVISAHNKSGN